MPSLDHVGDDGLRVELLLLAALHVLQERAVLAEERDVAGAEAAGLLELALARAARQLELDVEARAARLGGERERDDVGAGDVEVGDRLALRRRLGGQQQALDARGPADAGHVLAADLAREAVVAPAAADA